jgi:hypothetical protein
MDEAKTTFYSPGFQADQALKCIAQVIDYTT